ncbi:sigma-54-dependent transcriptional regulator [Sulfuritalea hydrogenivorans]|jgi:two-component system response regulator HupR/HoxA|uniref:Fis family two component sigma-54 specific transcriptional regulator n=1 Tax=Sulfuritalea hydrogenivorans sk43H TaxID=1223802 RepID=W0SGD6_9PROT|nr:sigma-54 dependent transcriptional regulator [Sulfuritalea hydrogenivorans]MDK9712515.1 sigma-54 dependent transcriptional regulator [Sulfuritalea sp.]BAO29810.1 Fis family two component sigma-54 specific transcriptional regulator [Sulfuritalea hydrogenivorans sk43H]
MNARPRAPLTVLVVDDELRSLETLRRTLEEDFTVFTAPSADEGEAIMGREFVHIVVSDQRMPGTSGVEFLRRVRSQWPETVRLILSGYTEAEDIISGINDAGIWQYLLKPWHPDQLLLTLKSAGELWRLQQENQRLSLELRDSPEQLVQRVASRRGKVCARSGFDRLTRAADSPLNGICALAQKIAGHELSVLVTGESGTGKELLARAIHYTSERADRPFVVENCGAMPDTLLEAELFGHKRGAFTGAHEDRIGLFQQADGGTLFLDEIGDTSPAFQVKLLRALQEGEVRPVGSPRSVPVDVRIIAATNRNLEADVASGRFRQDLYYRIAGITFHMPALRERPQDIPLIVADMFKKSALAGRRFTAEAMKCLVAHRWPGNVRELQNEVLRALALGDGDELGAGLFSSGVRQSGTLLNTASPAFDPEGATLKELLDQVEAQVINAALLRHNGNKTRVAEELGLTRVGLRMKLARLGLGGES